MQGRVGWKRLTAGIVGILGWVLILTPTWAQSGGRARGGSFSRPSSQPSAPSRSAPSGGGYASPYDYSVPPDRSYAPRNYPGYRQPSVIVVPPQSYPVPVDPYGSGAGYGTSSAGDSLFLVLVLVGGVTLLPMAMAYMRQAGGQSSQVGRGKQANDIVTVTQLQVALLAEARAIQADLTRLSAETNLDNQAGLQQLLQETVLALLRSPENWSHAKASSQTVKSREQAAQVFEQLSIQARSKLTAETLVNTGGPVRRQAVAVSTEAGPASYIVVTMLVGTADDRPLVQPNALHSAEELTAILKRLGGIAPSYLMIYELIWTPQDATDSLSRDQLLTHYPDLIQIA